MQAFGPYAGCEVVDFREAIASGLFGIYGQTGSGKSTIFSAMTFMLINSVKEQQEQIKELKSQIQELTQLLKRK